MMISHPAVKSEVFHLVILDSIPIFYQLQLEEALLRADARNWCLINRGSIPSIVMGISGKEELLVHAESFAKKPVPLIRRFSGGGTVFVDEGTFFISWICNTKDTHTSCCPSAIHQWTEKFYSLAFFGLNMQLRENDYIIGDRKFGGNAQYLCRDRWIHHSSLLWDYCPENMKYLLMPPKMPAYRENRPHEQFLCRLKEHFPSKDMLENRALESLYSHFSVKQVSYDEAWKTTHLPHRKSTIYIDNLKL